MVTTMSDQTAIAWTEKTWNPWHGCEKVSPGCKFCYMFREKRQYGQDPEIVVQSKTKFRDPLKWKEPSLVFTCSWSDWFIAQADAWRRDAYDVIQQTPHTYQILTKRIARLLVSKEELVPPDVETDPRIWWGVSVEDQKYGLPRIDILRRTLGRSGQLFLSIEPLLENLGAVDLSGIAWAIIGGESGPERRTMDVPALASLVEQCAVQNVPCFVKQDSGFKSGLQGRIPDELFVRQFPAGMVRL